MKPGLNEILLEVQDTVTTNLFQISYPNYSSFRSIFNAFSPISVK